MRRHDQQALQFLRVVPTAGLEQARRQAAAFEAAVSTSSTTWAQCVAEGIRIELMDPLQSHGLASRCLTTRPTFQDMVVAPGVEPGPARL
jgi:hypothetical protein